MDDYHQRSTTHVSKSKTPHILFQTEDVFHLLFKNHQSVMYIADLETFRIIDANDAALRFYKYDKDTFLTMRVPDLNTEPESEIRAEIKKAVEEGRNYYIFKHQLADGTIRDIEIYANPININGKSYSFSVINDITERLRTERELKEAKEKANLANLAKSQFLSNMSHELRTPLNAVLGFSDLMSRDTQLSQSHKNNLSIIKKSGEHLLSLINSVLEISKIESGSIGIKNNRFDFPLLIKDINDLFALKAKDKNLHLDFELPDNLPRFIKADQGKLRQVLINIIGNAIKYTEKGSVKIRITRAEIQSDNPSCILGFEIKDTGPGIPEPLQDKIFDPFFRAKNTNKDEEGTGLGLAISNQYVDLMGGELYVQSRIGVGSIFSFNIPTELVDVAEGQRVLGRVIGVEPGQENFRILIIENNHNNRRLLTTLLELVGFDVQTAKNGLEGVEQWRAWSPHFIWMDIRMPLMDGFEATRIIKQEMAENINSMQSIIVALTASAFEEERTKVLAQGCDDFLRKPFNEQEIFEILEKYLNVKFIYSKEI
jgi:PAS domain S-box-containing protein